jgi:hypothetical protein
MPEEVKAVENEVDAAITFPAAESVAPAGQARQR